jgi:hypothetical protein
MSAPAVELLVCALTDATIFLAPTTIRTMDQMIKMTPFVVFEGR